MEILSTDAAALLPLLPSPPQPPQSEPLSGDQRMGTESRLRLDAIRNAAQSQPPRPPSATMGDDTDVPASPTDSGTDVPSAPSPPPPPLPPSPQPPPQSEPRSEAQRAVAARTAKVLCWMEGMFKVSDGAHRPGDVVSFAPETAASWYEKWLLDIAKSHEGDWLPIEMDIIVKLQASKTGERRYGWTGIVAGGGRMPLPEIYVTTVYARDVLREAKRRADDAFINDTRPVPVDVTDVGAAVPSSSVGVGLASASATVVVGAPEVCYPQGDKDYCVAYSAASAVHHAGDVGAAATIAALAAKSISLPTGVNRVKYVTNECLERLQPAWRTTRMKNVQQLDKEALLRVLRTDGVVTVIQLERHCVAAYGGWLFDPNKPHAVRLDASGLDACCLGTYVGAHAGFQLARPTPKRSGENDPGNSPKKPRKA